MSEANPYESPQVVSTDGLLPKRDWWMVFGSFILTGMLLTPVVGSLAEGSGPIVKIILNGDGLGFVIPGTAMLTACVLYLLRRNRFANRVMIAAFVWIFGANVLGAIL